MHDAGAGVRPAGRRGFGQDQRDRATAAGYTVVDPTTALSTHLSETIRTFLPDLLSRQQTKELVDRVAQTSPKLVEELVPKLVSIGEIQRVLRQLLRERVPIRDLATILEAIADAAAGDQGRRRHDRGGARGDRPRHLPAVSERQGRAAGHQPGAVARRAAAARRSSGPSRARCSRSTRSEAQSLATRIAEALEHAMAQPVLLCTPALRPHLWRLFARVLPHLGVLSHNEVPPHVQVAPVAVLD